MAKTIILAGEGCSNEDMIQIAMNTGRLLERAFPDKANVAEISYTYGEDRTGEYQNRRGRRSLILTFKDQKDADVFKMIRDCIDITRDEIRSVDSIMG